MLLGSLLNVLTVYTAAYMYRAGTNTKGQMYDTKLFKSSLRLAASLVAVASVTLH